MTQAQARTLALRTVERIRRKMPAAPWYRQRMDLARPPGLPAGGGGRLISTRPPGLRGLGDDFEKTLNLMAENPEIGVEELAKTLASRQGPGATQIVSGSLLTNVPGMTVEPSASASSTPSLSVTTALKLPTTPRTIKSKSALASMALPAAAGVALAFLGLKLFAR